MVEAMRSKLLGTPGMVCERTPLTSAACILVANWRAAVAMEVRTGSFISACVVQETACNCIAERRHTAAAPMTRLRRDPGRADGGVVNESKMLRSIWAVTLLVHHESRRVSKHLGNPGAHPALRLRERRPWSCARAL